jgi:hypothetical protein
MASSKCSEKPIFIVIKETSTGYSFDNDVKYSSPFANHTITQTSDMTHPSIMVKSNWGMTKRNSITQLVTGNAGFKILKNRRNSNFYKSHSNGASVGLLLNDTHGYRLGRYKTLSGEAPSVAELANLLGSISRSSKDVKVRGSPVEYKRLLDYFQFLLTRKVSGDSSLFLTRPNNVTVLDAMNEGGSSLEDVYLSLFDRELSNRTMYNKAYFMTADRPAAIASVVRQVPTIFQEAASKKTSTSRFHLVPPGDNRRILQYLTQELRQSGFTSDKGIVSVGDLKIIDKTREIGWYLDTTLLFNKRVVPNVHLRALVLFYWIFNYPSQTSNIPIVEAFFSIVDTFHDFKPTTRTSGKGNTDAIGSLMGQNQNREKFKARKVNTINLTNVSNTRVAHKTLVRLLGSDIYRKVKSGYGKGLKNTVSSTNKRQISSDEKVGRFLYFVTNVFGSDSGGLINACEDLSRDILISISGNKPIYTRNGGNNTTSNELCAKLENEGACLIIDYMIGSLPDCLIKHSVFHNVGVLDPASKRILSWSEVQGGDGCIETASDKKKRKKKQAEAKARIKRLRNNRAQAAARERRKEQSKLTREKTRQAEINQRRREEYKLEKSRAEATARRAEATARRWGLPVVTKPFKMNQNPSNMKMTIGKVSPKKSTTTKKPTAAPTLKRSRNDNQNNNKPPVKRPPLPPRTVMRVSRGPNNAPSTGTRSVRSIQRMFNASPAGGTRSASARRTPGTRSAAGQVAGSISRTPGSIIRSVRGGRTPK